MLTFRPSPARVSQVGKPVRCRDGLFYQSVAEVKVLGGAMTLDAAFEFEGFGQFDAGVECFEVAGTADAEGDVFVFFDRAGVEFEVVPDQSAVGIFEGFYCHSIMLRILN
jgi:hypothetical protein